MSETNRQFKDRLFCFIFGREENKKWTLSLFNAINEMSEDAEIKLFLVGHRSEVKDMCLTEYDEKKHMEAVRAEGKEEGIEECVKVFL